MATYRYRNFDVTESRQIGLQGRTLQYQCGGKVTTWHGGWSEDHGGNSLKLAFDAKAGHRGNDGQGAPRLKTAFLFRTRNQAALQGYDYTGRRVHMYPLTQWTLAPDGQSWTCTAEWSTELFEWIFIES